MKRVAAASLCVALSACVGPDGPVGPAGEDLPGDPGAKGDPGLPYGATLTQIAPDLVYLGRELDVVISGSGTQWSEAQPPTLELGDGITVHPDSVVVASPTALRATITIEPSANPGLRDVRVVDGDQVARLEGAFVVEPSLVLVPIVPTAPNDLYGIYAHAFRGAVIPSAIVLLDRSTSFSSGEVTVTVGDQSYEPYGLSEDGYAAFFYLQVDVFAELGPKSVLSESGPPDARARSATGFPALTVAEHFPLTLQQGHNPTSVPAKDTPLLYRFDMPEAGLWTFAISGAETEADVYVLPESGHFDEQLGAERTGTPIAIGPPGPPPPAQYATRLFTMGGPGTVYLSYGGFGYAPSSGYAFDIQVSKKDVSTIAQLSEPGATGAIDNPGDADWYAFDGTMGQTVKLATGPSQPGLVCEAVGAPGMPGPPQLDTDLALVDESGKTIAFSRDVSATDKCSRFAFDLPADGTYYVRVNAGQPSATDATFPYRLDFEVL